jgi:arabinofuranosyltransferase
VRRSWGAGVAAVALAPTALLGVLGWTHRWNADDAFIIFRVVDQLVHGNGPVYNVGERVEAYTSPLWTALLSAGALVVGASHVEWIAVGLGLALSVAGLGLATVAALVLNGGPRRRDALLLPLGALTFAVLPPAWEFATSGLETGLTTGWLGATYLATVLVVRSDAWPLRRVSRERGADAAAVLAGLGPLVRPDLAIFSVALLGLIVGLAPPVTRRAVIRRLALAAALPVLYELFRMAYFAALVPNTALTKEAGGSDWERGISYLWNTLTPYVLLAPLVALSVCSLAIAARDARSGRRDLALLRGVPVVAGVLSMLYVVRLGGDFMHARMLLPGIFAILMPVAVVPVRRGAAELGWVGGLAAWAAVCGLGLRPPPKTSFRVLDERQFYLDFSGMRHPVTLYDYRNAFWSTIGADVRLRSARGERAVTFAGPGNLGAIGDLPLAPGAPRRFIAASGNIGMFGYAAGRDVFVVDDRGLTDPVASRLHLTKRKRAGHEKYMITGWVVARFADPRHWPASVVISTRAAHRALACGGLARVLADVDRPLTFSRAVSNVGDSFANTSLRFSRWPGKAARELC